MAYTCQTCAKRKVRCDKASPTCSSCRKTKLACIYEPPRPRLRKRRLSGDVLERLARYERILAQHGLLEADADTLASAREASPQESISVLWDETEGSRVGKILGSLAKTKYVSSKLWRDLGDDEIQSVYDSDDEGDEADGYADTCLLSDPFTGAFLGGPQLSLLQYHPVHEDAMALWGAHIQNVEPLCKILHLPSTGNMVERVSREPNTASKAEECLLFAIYHFAAFSMSDQECTTILRQSRDSLLRQYHFATRHALANASFLKIADFVILQALVLFLMPSGNHYDSNTYWILTGTAIRIAQRIGLHRDGNALDLPPFEVEMRRRLFYQLLPLDARASQMAGMGMSMPPDTWDTQPALNINDTQIWPGIAEVPQEQNGATDMIFCLSRVCLGKFFAKAAGPGNGAGPVSWHFKDKQQAEQAINQAESEVEEKFIRFCDVVNPLHFLTICMARAGITAMRLRIRLPRATSQNATDAEAWEAFQLALKILDTDIAISGHAGLKQFRWHIGSFSLWGTWDSFIFVLTTLWKQGSCLSATETDAAWDRVEAMYRHHDELVGSKRALYVAFGRLAISAWVANPPSRATMGMPDPDFVVSLRSARGAGVSSSIKGKEKSEGPSPSTGIISAVSSSGLDPDTIAGADPCSVPSGMGLELGGDCGLDVVDWTFWDDLIQGHETQIGQQEGDFIFSR